MSGVNKLFASKLNVINLGLEPFSEDLRSQNVDVTQVDWRPVAGGNEKVAEVLNNIKDNADLSAKIASANEEALKRIFNAKPMLVGVGTALDNLPNFTKHTILHAGPPVTWDRMSGPLKGAVIGGLIYEGLASNEEEATALAASGKITFDPCHHRNAVGPMAGVVTASMPVFIIKNEDFGNEAYCTLNEGLGKVLRFGAFGQEVIDRLKWMENTLAPIIKATIALTGPIDLKNMIAQALMMGDEVHNRNKAATSLFTREIAPYLASVDFDKKDIADVFKFLQGNDHFFLNLSMPAAKATLEAAKNIDYCSLLFTMARNGTDFGIRVSGLGEQWFAAPAEIIKGLYFPGYSEDDANPDIGDSAITETCGIGAFAMAAAPAIVQFIGGTPQDAVNYSTTMRDITQGMNNTYKIPILDFTGTGTGIDILKVVETNILPVINTGIAHKNAGVGQVGAGVVSPPAKCFYDAIEAFGKKYI